MVKQKNHMKNNTLQFHFLIFFPAKTILFFRPISDTCFFNIGTNEPSPTIINFASGINLIICFIESMSSYIPRVLSHTFSVETNKATGSFCLKLYLFLIVKSFFSGLKTDVSTPGFITFIFFGYNLGNGVTVDNFL